MKTNMRSLFAAVLFAAWPAFAGNVSIDFPLGGTPYVNCGLSFNGTCSTSVSPSLVTVVAMETTGARNVLPDGTVRYLTWYDPANSDPLAAIDAVLRLIVHAAPAGNGFASDNTLTFDFFRVDAPEFNVLRLDALGWPLYRDGTVVFLFPDLIPTPAAVAYDLAGIFRASIPEPPTVVLALVALAMALVGHAPKRLTVTKR